MTTRLEGIKEECLQDSWVILYTFIAKELTERRGSDGEQILREAVRRYGCDRGLTNQKRLLDHNIKINLLTLFNEGRDRPGEPRFTSCTIRNTREERISETLICSFADVWKKYDAKWLGRIYCEEFHLACYEAFSFGKAKINLTRSLTQDGDDRCRFYHTYRPENLSDQERKLSFEEFDPGYEPPTEKMPKPQGKSGFNMLWIKMYYYLLECSVEALGDEEGRALVAAGLRRAAKAQAEEFLSRAAATEQLIDEQFMEDHLPISLDYDSEPLWAQYDRFVANQLFRDCFGNNLLYGVGLT